MSKNTKSHNYKYLFFVFIYFISSDLQALTRIGIASDKIYCGEREVGWRIKRAAGSLGWEVHLDEEKGKNLINIKKLDFVIWLTPKNHNLHPNCANYTTIFYPSNYFDPQKHLLQFYDRYDGYLMTFHQGREFPYVIGDKKKLFLPFYPTSHPFPYKQVSPNYLMTMIAVWGDRLANEKFQSLYRLLSLSGFARFYGNENPDLIPYGYMGKLPFDGISVLHALQDNGIALVLHSETHIQEQIPSARIFEAAAASAVIISDRNPFVIDHFGDCVYYIDTSRSAIEIFDQIKNHMDEIYAHPEEALEKAKKAHEIFSEHFQMTDQLLKLEKMHRQRNKKS